MIVIADKPCVSSIKDWFTNYLPASESKDFPVRPELVEGCTGKSWRNRASNRPCFDCAQHERFDGISFSERFWLYVKLSGFIAVRHYFVRLSIDHTL
jgi:hypothetical protein